MRKFIVITIIILSFMLVAFTPIKEIPPYGDLYIYPRNGKTMDELKDFITTHGYIDCNNASWAVLYMYNGKGYGIASPTLNGKNRVSIDPFKTIMIKVKGKTFKEKLKIAVWKKNFAVLYFGDYKRK